MAGSVRSDRDSCRPASRNGAGQKPQRSRAPQGRACRVATFN